MAQGPQMRRAEWQKTSKEEGTSTPNSRHPHCDVFCIWLLSVPISSITTLLGDKILRVGGLRPPLHPLILLYGCVRVYIIIIILNTNHTYTRSKVLRHMDIVVRGILMVMHAGGRYGPNAGSSHLCALAHSCITLTRFLRICIYIYI